jgi:hypothetical protein
MKRIIGITFFVFAVTLFSCQNDKVDIAVEDGLSEKSAEITLKEVNIEAITTTLDYEVEFYANAEQMLTRWWNVGKRWEWTNKTHYQIRQCPLVTIEQGDDNGYPKKITLDYGDGTVLKNEKVLSGIIIVEISAPMKSGTYSRMVSYDNFAVDNTSVEGTSLFTVDKSNEEYRNQKSDLTITLNDEKQILRSSTRTWTWVEGMETTDDQTDDVIHIDGMVSASNSDGDSYEKKIISPLVRLRDCRFIVAGTVQVTLNNTIISILDYGDGECDAVAMMTTLGGEPVEVDLSTFKRKENQQRMH